MVYRNGGRINGVMRVRDIGQWQVALWKSQRAIETSREQAIRHCWDTTKSIIVDKEPPYADPHVRWCERSENESRKKTFVFLLLDLMNFDFTFFFFGLWLDHLWNTDVKDSIFNSCFDLLSLCILWEK